VIVHPNGHREIEGVTPKQLPPPSGSSHMLPNAGDPDILRVRSTVILSHARPPLPAALCHRISNRTNCTHNIRQLAACFFFIIECMSRSNVKVASRLRHPRS